MTLQHSQKGRICNLMNASVCVCAFLQTPKAGQTQTVSGSHSKIRGCPLASGTYKCRLEGPATKCLDNSYSLEASVFINSSLVSEMTSQFIFIYSCVGHYCVTNRYYLNIVELMQKHVFHVLYCVCN